MDERITELEKFAEIGRLFPGLLHDILNPITGLMLYFDSMETGTNNQAQCQLDSVLESSNKIRDFIRIIQKFIHGQKSEIMDVNEVIQNVIKIMATKARQNHITILFLRKNKVRTNCPPIFLYQIIINLLSNAIDAYDEITDTKDRRINIILEKLEGEIIIQIIDNGIGVEIGEEEKIFNPFYTTKETGTGTGLPTVKNIVEKELEGNIEIESIVGRGTTFKISFPLKNQK